MKPQDMKESEARKIVVYGDPKTGKTDLVAQLAEIKKLHWFDMEKGFNTVLHSPRVKKEWYDNFEVYQIPDTQIMPVACRTMLNLVKGKPGTICEAHGVWNCVICTKNSAPVIPFHLEAFTNNDVLVIDSVTRLAESVMNDIRAPILKAEQFDKKPEWDDYFNQGTIMKRIFGILQQSRFNVVAISHTAMTEMEDKSKRIVPVGGTDKFSNNFAGYFDDVVYCELVNGTHRFAVHTGYKNNVVTGSRTGKVLDEKKASLLELFK